MIKLPNEILEYIKLFIPFNIMKNIRRESNEFRKAKLITPTGSSHCMYLMTIRFIWRWNYSSISLEKPIIINELNIEIPKFYSKSYETVFINNSLAFHKLWTGPNIPYSEYNSEINKRNKPGIYIGSL